MNNVNCENENIKEANMSKVDDGKNQGTYIKQFCPVCKTSLPVESRFCPHCGSLVGARAKNTCETCGSSLQDDANYCIKCGTPVWGRNVEIQSLTDEGCTYDGMTRDTLESVKYINSNIGTFVLSDAFGNLHDQYMKQVSFVYHSADDSWGCEKGVLEFGICDDVRWTHKYVNSECKINEWAGFCYSDGKNNRVENLTEGKEYSIVVHAVNGLVKYGIYENIADLEASAAKGNAGALYGLGNCFQGILGVSENKFRALNLLYQAANAGQRDAQKKLGFYFYNELRNDTVAAKWFQKAAAQGEPGAQAVLGDFYYWGRGGIQKDYGKAFELYKKSAEQGESSGLYWLATLCYLKGHGVKKNYDKAVEILKKLAEDGDTLAQDELKELGEPYKKPEWQDDYEYYDDDDE